MNSTDGFRNVSHGDPVEAMVYNECRCIGNPLRFVPGECFTCGRFLPGVAGRLNADDRREAARPGLGALMEAVNRTRDKMNRKPAPRGNHRRVVIEEKVVETAPAGQTTHGGRRTKPRSKVVRDAMWRTARTF